MNVLLMTRVAHAVVRQPSRTKLRVIKDNWSELQALKRILIDEHPDIWREIKNNEVHIDNLHKYR